MDKIPQDWLFIDIIEEEKIYNTQLREIIQEDTNIKLRMNRWTSFKALEPQHLVREGFSRHSVDGSTISFDLKGLDNSVPKISRLVYEEKKRYGSPTYSPTTSQILNTLTREPPFKIDKQWIRDDFEAPYNKILRDWFFSAFTKGETNQFRELVLSIHERKWN